MQDEVGAETQTLELGESTILEEDKIHLSLRPLLGVMVKSNLGTKALVFDFDLLTLAAKSSLFKDLSH